GRSTAARIPRLSLQQALGEVGPEERAMTAVLVGASAEQGDPAAPGVTQHLVDLRLGLGALETGEVPRHVGLPANALVEKVTEQGLDRSQLLQPEIDAVLADATRPQAHDEH